MHLRRMKVARHEVAKGEGKVKVSEQNQQSALNWQRPFYYIKLFRLRCEVLRRRIACYFKRYETCLQKIH